MNANDRKQLQEALDKINEALETIDFIKESESEKFENLTAGLQASEMGNRLAENADLLDSVISDIENAVYDLDNLINL